jgi:hypothetical protein
MSTGGGGPSSSTVTQSTIPEEFYPQITGLLNAAGSNLFEGYRATPDGPFTITGIKPFQAYGTQAYQQSGMPGGGEAVAGYNPNNIAYAQQLQQNALGTAGWLGSPTGGQQFINEEYGTAGNLIKGMGRGGANAAAQAMGYGGQGAGAGALGQQLGTQGGAYYGGLGAGYGGAAAELAPFAEQFAGQAAGTGDMYEQMATDPAAYQRFMSPYMQQVVAQQQEGARRQADISGEQRKAAAARAGAFGGARQAIENAEANRALQSQLAGIEAKGLQDAYTQAQGNILNRSQLGLQGLAGAQQGLGQAGQLYGMGMQGAGMGLQGLQQQLAGTAQGMQGAQAGLQGVQTGLGAYGLMGQAGQQLAGITGDRMRDIMSIGQYQYGLGEQQRALEQQAINQQIQNWAMSQQAPMQALTQYNALLRGFVTPGQTVTQYQASPPITSQLAGLGTAGFGLGQLANVGKKAGGVIKENDGIDRLALRDALAGK